MNKIVFIISLFFIFVGCKKKVTHEDTEFKVYTIKKHKSNYAIKKSKTNSIEGSAMFTPSCEYELTKNIGQINKLVGLSNGIDHHTNSIRIGWVFNEDKFDLYAYYYYKGDRNQHKMVSVETNEVFTYSINISESGYNININDTEHIIEASQDIKTSYILWPYFGGEEPFPNEKPCEIYLKINQ